MIPPKKPYTKEQFFKSTLTRMKGVSGGMNRTMMVNGIVENGNKLRRLGVPRKEVISIISKAKTAHDDWLRNTKLRKQRKYFGGQKNK